VYLASVGRTFSLFLFIRYVPYLSELSEGLWTERDLNSSRARQISCDFN
jgi:hypothetical protein